ncbi:MAG: HAD-IA family hydrolase [Litorilituus sp.]|nr:HAD-IA family hydrolase [Litorilituus sp.]
MKFYRRLSPIKAISFDLDDNLYSNKPIMVAIEKKMIAYFSQTLGDKLHTLPKNHDGFTHKFWFYFRKQAITKQPELKHDVVRIRFVAYQLGIEALGYSPQTAANMAQAALDYFICLRSGFSVPESSIRLLSQLSQCFPLVAISNGNVDTKALGIDQFFQYIYHAGWQKNGELLRQKPAADMFELACKQLAIEPKQLLHVGDCGQSDIQGALNAGCQAAWLSCYDVGKPINILPHIELSQISQLNELLTS